MNLAFLTAVFLLSGAVILYCLQKLGFNVAKNVFLLVFGLLSILIPFVLGGKMTIKIFTDIFFRDNPDTAQTFGKFMLRNLNAGMSIFNATTVIIAVSSLIVLIAFLIVSVYAAIRIVRFIRKIGSSGLRKTAERKTRRAFYRGNKNICKQKVYLRFCRLLN